MEQRNARDAFRKLVGRISALEYLTRALMKDHPALARVAILFAQRCEAHIAMQLADAEAPEALIAGFAEARDELKSWLQDAQR